MTKDIRDEINSAILATLSDEEMDNLVALFDSQKEELINKVKTIMDKDMAEALSNNIQIMNDGKPYCNLCGYDPIRQREYLINQLESKP